MHISKQKKPIRKGYILYNSKHDMLEKKKISFGKGWQRGRKDEWVEHRRILGQ
jgi:hypothetical protein